MSENTDAIPLRQIGKDKVTALGYGCMGLSAFYGDVPSDEERFKILDGVLASGITFWDTADVYSDSEVLLGKWFKRTGKRSDIFLATKFGIGPDFIVNGSPEYVRKACASSLEKLGVEQIDLYYFHRPDKNTPIEHTISAMSELVKEGKVKYIGLSECSARTLRRAHAVHPISAIQLEYSPFALDIEDPKIEIMKTARELGVTIIAYSPLGRGILTGRYSSQEDFSDDDFRKSLDKYSNDKFPMINQLIDDLKSIGAKHRATAGQVSLAWLLAQGEDIIPIPGTKSIKYHNENAGSLKVKLSPEEVQEVRDLAEAIDKSNVGLSRYPPGMQEELFGDTPEL